MELEPQEAYHLIRAACLRRPELAYQAEWEKDVERKRMLVREMHKAHPYKGLCYIASHLFSYLTGAEVWAEDSGQHYWNVLNGEIWDLTKEQFNFEYPYSGYKVPRKNKLTERIKELYDELG